MLPEHVPQELQAPVSPQIERYFTNPMRYSAPIPTKRFRVIFEMARVILTSACLVQNYFRKKEAMVQRDGNISKPAAKAIVQCKVKGSPSPQGKPASPMVQVTVCVEQASITVVLPMDCSTCVGEILRAAREVAGVVRSCPLPEMKLIEWSAMRVRLGGRMLLHYETLDELWDGQIGATGGIVFDCCVLEGGGMDTSLPLPSKVYFSLFHPSPSNRVHTQGNLDAQCADRSTPTFSAWYVHKCHRIGRTCVHRSRPLSSVDSDKHEFHRALDAPLCITLTGKGL